MYGADLDNLRTILLDFEKEKAWVSSELIGSFDLQYRPLFWLGPDKQRTRDAITALIDQPLAHFYAALEQAETMLRDGAIAQGRASASGRA